MKKKIVFILSAGRSGSTLIDKALGSHSNCFSMGEIINFSSEFSKNETLCGCGQWLKNCSFWEKVNKSLQDKKIQNTPPEYNIQNHNPYKGVKKKIYGLANILGYYHSDDKKTLIKTKILFDTISDISRRNILIDSSKAIGRSFLLKHFLKDYDIFFIHLIRDGKAVINSQKKAYYNVRIPDGNMHSFHSDKPLKSSEEYIKKWKKYNLKVIRLMRLIRNKRKYTLKYEDFVKNPEKELKKISSMIGIDYQADMKNLNNNYNHIIGGNPSRVNAQYINKKLQKEYPNLSAEDIQIFEKIAGKLNQKLSYN